MFCTNYLITPEEHPKVYFPLYLETKIISASEEHILSSFLASFQCFSLKLGGNIAQNHAKKTVSVRFYFWLLLKVLTILVNIMHVLSTLKV